MTILPQSPTPAYPGRRWRARHYPATPATCTRFRAELRADLEALAGIPHPLRDDIELCGSEAFANAVTHSRSQRPGGSVIRMLSTPIVMGHQTTVRLSVIDDGPLEAHPLCPPARRTVQEWEQAESGRGLLLIHRLASEWGTQRWTDPTSPAVLGTVLWAEFTYPTTDANACVCGGRR